MNYVAHLLLTYPFDEISLGNLMGDMLSNKELTALSEQMQRGVQIHRAIDHHTDNHVSMREVVRLLRPQHRKYAPVVADILLDHVLVLNWEEHSNISFSDFEDWVYDTIEVNMSVIPLQLHHRLKSMVKHRWLQQYSSLSGMQFVLERMDRRAQFPSDFASAIKDFNVHYRAMQNALSTMFPDLTDVVLSMQKG